MNNPRGGSSCPLFQVELKFGMLILAEGGKLEDPEKTDFRSKDENQQQTQRTCDAGSWN